MNNGICFFISLLFCCFTLVTKAQVLGCTDVEANNYNATATINDGSCLYNNTTIVAIDTILLSDSIAETSGLIFWDSKLWSHNDDTDLTLYALDTLTGSIKKKQTLTNCINTDWEEISQDSLFVYVGDFGNNASGNRTNLQILRILKSSIINNTLQIDTIKFSYSNQTNFASSAPNNTNYDCEAFIVSRDSIYLFTKQWLNKKTRLFVLSKQPGTHSAMLRDSLNAQGLITGATYLEDKKVIALCGYTQYLQPFVTLLYDFKQHHFFKGNKRRLEVSLPFYQTEGITTHDGNTFFISNEKYINTTYSVNTQQSIHVFDFSSYLNNYYQQLATGLKKNDNPELSIVFYPNPVAQSLSIKSTTTSSINYSITSMMGDCILTGTISPSESIDLSQLSNGIYVITLSEKQHTKTIKFAKIK